MRLRFKSLAFMGALVLCLASVVTACGGDGEDRPGVETIGSSSGSVSGSASGSGTGSGTGSATGSGTESGTATSFAAIGGYEPVSDVTSHSLLVSDVADINGLLGAEPYDFAAIEKIYVDGKNSVKGSGSVRTLAGYARNDGRSEPIWDDYTTYYGDQTWLDTFVSSAINGTGVFAGEADKVRRQGIQKGIQNQIMISYVIHELVVALTKAADGNFDPAKGAPHNWDEAWAFYHGVDPGNGPYATADKRGKNFGTGTAVNDAILAAMIEGRDALVAGNGAAAQAATAEIIRQVQITYIQATIRYANKITGDINSGDMEKARIHQAEGWAFFRVIEPLIDPDVAAKIAGFYDLSNEPSVDAGPAVLEAIESVYGDLNISPSEVGTLQ